MPELRQNLISRDWVIIATERAKRPEDFVKKNQDKKIQPEYSDSCPFCPGKEAQTPPETFRIGDPGRDRQVRVVYNKFAALSHIGEKTRKIHGTYRSMNGVGIHEVIIEHPKHNVLLALMNDYEIESVIKTYRERYLSIQKDKRIESITIFKNHGAGAGTSLEHPHSQIIATPIVPPQVRSRIGQAINYFDDTGKCIFCHTLQEELSDRERIVVETEQFVAFVPYAALSPFHIWIFPRRHMASFVEITQPEISDLSKNLRKTLRKIYYGLDDPAFNYTIRSIPVGEKENDYFHWYISLIPRVSQTAGFELGSGMFINIALPEASAKFLREIK
ncbi:MAG: galactose-1-phosphate uridylyltransferase [Planctomycetota bacterium]|nr:galactose-1-phosphate uridylyltransferase [Planctomycetota bacterium]